MELQDFYNLVPQIQSLKSNKSTETLTHIRQLYGKLNPEELSLALYKITEHIMKLKKIDPECQEFLEECLKDVIKIAVQKQLLVGTEALRNIFDTYQEYYRHVNTDLDLKYPLGYNRPLKNYEPEIGEECDIVKPYISSTNFCGWTRGIVLAKNNNKYTINFANTQNTYQTKDIPFCAPLGSRTQDFDWRMNLKVGQIIDGFNKIWYPATITEVGVQNGAKRVRVSFRIFSQNGAKTDFQDRKYDGLGPNQDEWMDVLSYRIQKHKKMSKSLCYYTHTSDEFVLDDTYDLLFQKQYEEKPFHAIMRLNFTRSQSFLTFYEVFCQAGGHQAALKLLSQGQILNNGPIQCAFNALIIIANTSFMIPRMRVQSILPQALKKAIQFLYANTKNLLNQRNEMTVFFIDVVAKRIMSLSQKHALMNEVRKKLIIDFLKMNMERQMIALRIIYELINPAVKKHSQKEKAQVDKFLVENNLFYQIILPNIHQQILLRSVDLIKYLIQNKLIAWKEIEYLWNIFPQTDTRGRSTIEKMIGQVSKVFQIQYTSRLIDRLLSYKESQLTIDNLALLRMLKDHKQLTDAQKIKILKYLWQIITVKSKNITSNIEEEIQKVFKAILPTLKSYKVKLELLELLVKRLDGIKTINNQFDILKDFILSYPKTAEKKLDEIEQEATQIQQKFIPVTVQQVIEFLKRNNIYQRITAIFSQIKNNDKMKNLLYFSAFLFEYDSENVNQITKVFYEKMGPSDVFLEWAQHITHKTHEFFLWFFQNQDGISKFQKLSSSGFQALKTIIFDINVKQGNLKLVKKTRGVSVQVETQKLPGPVQGPVVQGPAEKPQTLTYLYLLKSPFQCKGMHFLQQLLSVVKSTSVYDEIIKMIIEFFVNLDESIENRTKQFRQQFLMGIIQSIEKINIKNENNDKIKLKLEIYINLLQQLFSATQKEGLLDIKPHFQCVAAENLKLKIENQIIGNKLQDLKIQISENATLYSLKKLVGQLYNQNPTSLNVYKFVTPISDDLMAKSLTELHFFNDQSIKVMRKTAKDIPRKELLDDKGQNLSERFNKIIETWFNCYKNADDLMGIQELKQLSGESWKGSLLREVNKLNQMIKKFDTQQKGALTMQEFKQFFISKSAQNPSAIWRIINLSGYKNNLKYKDQIQQQISPQIYPRRILSNQKVYATIFSILSNKTFQNVHLNFYRLLSMLQTDKNLKQEVKKNAKSMIEDQVSLYKLSYILETILSQILSNDQFYIQFYKNKGHQFVYHKLVSFMSENKSIYAMDTLLNTIIMPNMIKILNSYMFCLFSENKLVRFIRAVKINQADMDALTEKLLKINEIIGQKNEFQQKLLVLKSIECSINIRQYYTLVDQIFLNLIQNFNSNLLQKITNESVRMIATLSVSLNIVNRDQLMKGIKCQSLNFRRACQNIMYLFVKNNPEEAKPVLDMLLQNMPEQSKSIYSYYFTLMQRVLDMYLEQKKQCSDDTQFIQLANKLFHRLFNDLPNEKRNYGMDDKLLVGVLVVINVLLTKRKSVRNAFKDLKKVLLEKCLFFYNPKSRIEAVQITEEMLKTQKQANHFDDYVKCKTEDTRKIMMEIIYHLHQVSAQQDPEFIDNYILPIFNDLPKQKRKFDTKVLSVGLNNLGSTCYLNSMLQVLNSVQPFRNGLMRCSSQAPLVKQLQNLFSYVYFSQRQDYVPEQLLKAFTPPIMKGIQQDTTEFLNILFDQLQHCIKGTQQNRLLEQIFQGTQSVQMICHSCKKKRERSQQFFTYAVDIEGKYDLDSALQGMYGGELINDCFCQNCGQKADHTKRNVLESIPNIFLVHLRRIVFSYDMFMNTKIHTRLEFPNELNIEPYTKQGLELRQSLGVEYLKHLSENEEEMKKFEQLVLHGHEKEFYKLKLKGIIVHSGGPQSGHYWALTHRDPGWIKYDDSRVSVFPHSNMENQCFGGNMVGDEWGGMGSSTNAYVLIYQKQIKSDIIIGQSQNKQIIPYEKFETYNTPEHYKQVWLDNHSLMLENHLLRDSYSKQFIHFLISMLQISPSHSKVKVISQTLYKVCFKSGQVGKLCEAFLKNLDQVEPEIFRKYINGDKERTFDLLMHNMSSVRQFTAVFVEKVILVTFDKGSHQDRQNIIDFLDNYLKSLHKEVAKNWLRIDGYFKLFQGLVVNSFNQPQLYSWLLEKHLISYFIDFIMQKASPLSIYPKNYSIGTKSNPANFGNALNTIFFLIKHSYGLTGQNYQIPTIQSDRLFHLSDNEVLCLSSIDFYVKMLKERQNLDTLGFIIQRMSIKNLPFSEAISRAMLITLNQITDAKDDMRDICSCISKFLTITDQFWMNRAEFVLGYSSPYIYNQNLIDSIEQDRFVYYSTLEDLFPVQCLMAYAHINRQRNPLAVLQILKAILESSAVSKFSKFYLLSQKSPTYCTLRYIDWIRPYVNTVVQTLNVSKDKRKKILQQVSICNNLLDQIEKQKQNVPINALITGKIMNCNIVDRFSDSSNQIQVVISNVETYGLESLPNGSGNAALDQYLTHGRNNRKVTVDSNILNLFKEFNKPLAIKQAIQEDEDKQIQELFNDCPDNSYSNKDKQMKQNKNQEKNKKVENQQMEVEQQLNVMAPPKIIEPPKPKDNQNAPEQKKQTSKIEEEEPQKIQEVNIDGLTLVPDYFRKIQIFNTTEKAKRVTLRFKVNQNSNMLVPTKIYFLSSHKTVQTMWVCKVDHLKGWGAIDYELIVEDKQAKNQIPKWFKQYGQQQNNFSQPMEIQQNIGQNLANQNPTPNVPINDDNIPVQINCPVCTMFNLSTNSNCEVCGSSLR